MPLVHIDDMLGHARAEGYAVGAFEAIDSTFIAAIVAGAEAADAPVIIGFPGTALAGADFPVLMAAAVTAARRARVPVALCFDSDDGGAMIRHDKMLSDLAVAAASDALAPLEASYAMGIKAIRDAVTGEIARSCHALGAAGRAEAALAACRPWREVEHAMHFD